MGRPMQSYMHIEGGQEAARKHGQPLWYAQTYIHTCMHTSILKVARKHGQTPSYMACNALLLVPLRVLFVIVECRLASMHASLAHCVHHWVPRLSTDAQKQISVNFGLKFEPYSTSEITQKPRFACLGEVAVYALVLRVWRMTWEPTKHRCREDRKLVWYRK